MPIEKSEKAEKNFKIAPGKGNPLGDIVAVCVDALKSGKKLMFCGNGGSAEFSNHIVAEFVGNFSNKRLALNAVSLCSNMAVITAIANDFGFEQVFSRQLEANGQKGDVLFCVSTSGNSKNVLLASETAKKMGITTVAMTGDFKCALNESSSLSLIVEERAVQRIQEAQLALGHELVGEIEKVLKK